jgi:hypothetical protein
MTTEKAEKEPVKLSALTLRFSLPNDFGRGWDYDRVHIHGHGHQYAGEYDRTEIENFAYDALHRIPGIGATNLYRLMNCSVEFDVESLKEANAIQEKLIEVVKAFPNKTQNHISVRGSFFDDCKVTEYSNKDKEVDIVSDMPLLVYMAKHVPMSETHRCADGRDLLAAVKEFDDAMAAKHVAEGAKPASLKP